MIKAIKFSSGKSLFWSCLLKSSTACPQEKYSHKNLLFVNNFPVKFSSINDYFQMMHIVRGRFSEFKMVSISIPSSSSSSITTFSAGLFFYCMKTWFPSSSSSSVTTFSTGLSFYCMKSWFHFENRNRYANVQYCILFFSWKQKT